MLAMADDVSSGGAAAPLSAELARLNCGSPELSEFRARVGGGADGAGRDELLGATFAPRVLSSALETARRIRGWSSSLLLLAGLLDGAL
ncbi:MAG: hypothetical protein ABSB15_20320, partial [Bryobacteraceae bacterium]